MEKFNLFGGKIGNLLKRKKMNFLFFFANGPTEPVEEVGNFQLMAKSMGQVFQNCGPYSNIGPFHFLSGNAQT